MQKVEAKLGHRKNSAKAASLHRLGHIMLKCVRGIVDSTGPDQTVHLHSLIWACAVFIQNCLILKNVSIEGRGSDATV